MVRPYRIHALCLLLLFASPVSFLLGQSAQITGTVVNEAGSPVASANVALLARPPLPPGPPFYARATAATNGAFTFSGVPAGEYQVCASGTSEDYLDSCAWGDPAANAKTLRAVVGQRTVVPPIRLSRGVRLRLNLADPSAAMQRGETRPNERLHVRVAVPGAGFTLMPFTSPNPRLRSYEMLVPRQRAVKLRVFSSFFNVADAQGRTIDTASGHEIEVNAPAAGQVPPITLSVTSVRGGAQ